MIYLDNNSTTPIKPEVFAAMEPYLTDRFYNPSAPYSEGRAIAAEIESAREFFAKSINAEPEEIYFVSCGSEANTWALNCLMFPKTLIITDNIEHHSVLNALNNEAHIVSVDSQRGKVDVKKLHQTIKDYSNRNLLVSCMWINNEIGTIQPIKEIGDIVNECNTYFHVDAVQAYGKIPIDVRANHIDFLSVSSHKIGAPRGSGFLYVSKNTPFAPLIYGGQQERHMRAGTENVAGIIGFKTAAEIAMKKMDTNERKLWLLHDYLTDRLDKINSIKINNRGMYAYPSTISVNCGVPAEEMVAYLDTFGIYVSSGSACNSHSDEPSHVLKAIRLSDEEANNTIRISMSAENTVEELAFTAELIEKGIELLKR